MTLRSDLVGGGGGGLETRKPRRTFQVVQVGVRQFVWHGKPLCVRYVT